ncbi:hypothetical protein MKW98_021721 [Papaver atlanticum]|uniref:Uncharacterized protein n=1 Tax=Papaver atlanticum TaxID=357466 RepID=A0AAD4XCP6_9MAGN|nr:hypothetical protein MKW98_021721 [Papaver atlanticum]
MLTAINSRSAECLAVKRKKKYRMRIWKKDANSPSYPPFLIPHSSHQTKPKPKHSLYQESQQHQFPLPELTLSCFDSAGGFQTTTFSESLYSAVPGAFTPADVTWISGAEDDILKSSLNLMEQWNRVYNLDIRDIDKFPALETCTEGQIQVLGSCACIPSSSFVNSCKSPYPCSAIETEEGICERPNFLFHLKMEV